MHGYGALIYDTQGAAKMGIALHVKDTRFSTISRASTISVHPPDFCFLMTSLVYYRGLERIIMYEGARID
jgi:Pyruvate/2-oxoacid:ferredoxin oxidoreductase gamma subunit